MPAARRSPRPARVPVLVHQPTLLLGHGPVHWDTLPPDIRARALTLWLQLLSEHGTHEVTHTVTHEAVVLPPRGDASR